MGVLFTLPFGCLEVFLQSTVTGPNSEKNHESSDHEECLEFQLLVFKLFQSQFVDEDEAVGKSHRDSSKNLEPVRGSTACCCFEDVSQSSKISVLFMSAMRSCDFLLNSLISFVWLKS